MVGVGSRARYVRFTGWLCVVTGVALLLVAVGVAAHGQWPSAGAWCLAGVVLLVWRGWRLKSLRR